MEGIEGFWQLDIGVNVLPNPIWVGIEPRKNILNKHLPQLKN